MNPSLGVDFWRASAVRVRMGFETAEVNAPH